jgi:diguanylate cyclase (GGDEF)-like protein/excisionase family DNA binding protein
VTPAAPNRPLDATLSVTKAARLLGVHPNTVRAWSDQGRLRYYRINPRGDRRYRLGDLQGFLDAAEVGPRPQGLAEGGSRGGATRAVRRALNDTAIAAPLPARRRGDRLNGGGPAATSAPARGSSQMASWTAQLQSIQQLGARLNRLASFHEIGMTIATELGQLLDFHNVRVYRLEGRELVPVAMRGQVGEYVDETPEQLRVELGEGITGWVAEQKRAQNLPDAANDPRAKTIPGTEADLDESMLLAPMVFEDTVLGVLVLSKLGLRQFSDDDLRLLVIYASFAAQAMANADATEKLRAKSVALERQLRSQRELLQITESILTTLDSRAVLDQITDRLGSLVRSDNVAIEVVDAATGVLRPLTARGIHAADYLDPWEPGEEGLAPWVVAHNEPQLVVDELADPRVNVFRASGPTEGSLICVPLRGRQGATGVLTLERLGPDDRFSEEEFELVKLFAAQVSIALQNAEAHRVLAVRARTDALTGLLNHGTFQDWLLRSVEENAPFGLIMVDLDDFKAVNDALGHQAGDRLLHEIAAAIVTSERDSDLVFRYGGDEFTVIVPSTDRLGVLQVAERVRLAVHSVGATGTEWHDQRLDVSCSIGLATFPDDGNSAESILLAADRACFVAKRTGRGLIATADQGLALAGDLSLQRPTPVDPPSLPI